MIASAPHCFENDVSRPGRHARAYNRDMPARALLLAVMVFAAFCLHALDPAGALAKAKQEIAAGDNAAALRNLREAIAGAAALTDANQRAAALGAIHFYSALASSNVGDRGQAAEELRSFFFYNAGATLQVEHYPKPFAELFEATRRDIRRRHENPASFDDAYPGFPPAVSSSVWPIHVWGASSEFLILGTRTERHEWETLKSDDERRAFIERFWVSRDPDASTDVNEARIEFLHRIAFADVAFNEGNDGRGSLSDRGRVFVLLGVPQRVSVRPMNRREAWYAPRRTIDAGNALEQWTYFREQLPKKLPHNEVEFRFVSEGGSQQRTLQAEFLSETVLRQAPDALKND
jgi:GWxTD domain-containing protein